MLSRVGCGYPNRLEGKTHMQSREFLESVAEAYFSPHDNCPGRIVRLFADAQSSVDVCVFTITDDRISSAILAAHARGLATRIITDNDKARDAGSDVHRLAAFGVPVRIDRSPFHMHHKFAIFDRRVLVHGSYNWTRGAARDNLESIVVTNEPRLVSAFEREFERLWTLFT